MDIHVDIRGFLEIHGWICYGFSDQGHKMNGDIRALLEGGRDPHAAPGSLSSP